MVAITTTKPEEEMTTSIELVKDNGKPTVACVALAAAEIAVDVAIAYGVYRLLKLVKR